VKVAVLLNPSSGQDKTELQKLFVQQGVSAIVSELDPASITEKATELAKSFDIVVAGGGDGTVSAVASGLVGTKAALGILPLGTLNHFAKDLGIPLDVADAVSIIVRGRTKKVDVAEVNGWVFINNSSVGLYPQLVRRREEREDKIGKWPALALSIIKTLASYRPIRLRYQTEGKDVTARVTLAFVGNNDYGLEDPGVSNRASVDAGILSLYIMRAHGRLALVWGVVMSLGKPKWRHLERYNVAEVTIDPPGKSANVAMDGEVVTLETPLVYRIRPKALRVIVS
jgi:YegS/Rv2252/BmrU family lipid kinase